jgi:hypothetical protein
MKPVESRWLHGLLLGSPISRRIGGIVEAEGTLRPRWCLPSGSRNAALSNVPPPTADTSASCAGEVARERCCSVGFTCAEFEERWD